jgi:hypothetical protein
MLVVAGIVTLTTAVAFLSALLLAFKYVRIEVCVVPIASTYVITVGEPAALGVYVNTPAPAVSLPSGYV